MASQNTDPLANDHLKETDSMRASAKETHSVTRRLQQELTSLMLSSNPSVSAFPQGDNLFHWVGTIQGGKETVFEGMTFKLSLEFPSGYPFQAPKVRFTTPCFHPNVDNSGNICLDILKEKWSALYDVRTILLSIQSLLAEPNIKSPLNGTAANMWANQEAYDQHLREKFGKGSSS